MAKVFDAKEFLEAAWRFQKVQASFDVGRQTLRGDHRVQASSKNKVSTQVRVLPGCINCCVTLSNVVCPVVFCFLEYYLFYSYIGLRCWSVLSNSPPLLSENFHSCYQLLIFLNNFRGLIIFGGS